MPSAQVPHHDVPAFLRPGAADAAALVVAQAELAQMRQEMERMRLEAARVQQQAARLLQERECGVCLERER